MKTEVTAKTLIRRASDGKFLVLRSGVWHGRPDRSQQADLPGGLVEVGETCDAGALREIREETGIDIAPEFMSLIYGMSFISERDSAGVTRLIYCARIENNPTVTLSDEHEEYWWATSEELLAMDIREPYPAIFAYCKTIGLFDET